LKAISGKDFAKLLERHGWELKRVHGSHYVYTKVLSAARISVPIHGNQSLKTGLLKHLMKLANLGEADL